MPLLFSPESSKNENNAQSCDHQFIYQVIFFFLIATKISRPGVYIYVVISSRFDINMLLFTFASRNMLNMDL